MDVNGCSYERIMVVVIQPLSPHYENNGFKLMVVITQPLATHYGHQFPIMNDKALTPIYRHSFLSFKHTTRSSSWEYTLL